MSMQSSISGFFSDDNYSNQVQDIQADFSRGGNEYDRKLRQYLQRTGRKYNIGFEPSSPEFKRLKKSEQQKLRRLEKSFAKGRALAVAQGDFSLMKSWNIVHAGPFWLVGRTKALELWDSYTNTGLERYGVTIYQPGNISKTYLTRYNFNKALIDMDKESNRIQQQEKDSDRPEYRTIEANDQFNVYVIQEMIP